MIPTDEQIRLLWDKYDLPPYKRNHCSLVAVVADYLATRCSEQNAEVRIRKDVLHAAALLHDIDKNVSKLPGERHPDAGVRVLQEEGMGEVADLVSRHPLHLILDPSTAPSTWEEKILFLSDKMVKHSIITVDERFALWNAESMDAEAKTVLLRSYPPVKALEKEVLAKARLSASDLAGLANRKYT